MKLAYSTHGISAGLTDGSFYQIIKDMEEAGYEGVELAFRRHDFDPYEMTEAQIQELKAFFAHSKIRPTCVHPAPYFFDKTPLHEPSLLNQDKASRLRRIDLTQQAIALANEIGAPIVAIGSGMLRAEHKGLDEAVIWTRLVEGIKACMKDIGNVTLVLEPEPCLFIDTLERGIELVKCVDHPQFRLHIDMCHAYCTQAKDYLASMDAALPYTHYFHITDTLDGYNLVTMEDDGSRLDLTHAARLLYYPEYADYLLVSDQAAIYFYEDAPTDARKAKIKVRVMALSGNNDVQFISYHDLDTDFHAHQAEIQTYLYAVKYLSQDAIERSRPILHYLRNHLVFDKMLANSTQTGKVHFHVPLGEGELDFDAIYALLQKHQYAHWGAIELYHNGENGVWQKAMEECYHFLKGRQWALKEALASAL